MIALSRILVATDFSEPAGVAIRYGVELAKRFKAQLFVVHVVNDIAAHSYTATLAPASLAEWQTELENSARLSLAAQLPEPDRSAVGAQLDIVKSASPVQGILNHAHDRQVDLILVGTHGRHGLARVFLGSVARHVSGAAQCPVLVVRAHQHGVILRTSDRTSQSGI